MHGGATVHVVGEDDRSCSFGVCNMLGLCLRVFHVAACLDERLVEFALTKPHICLNAEWHAESISEMVHFTI